MYFHEGGVKGGLHWTKFEGIRVGYAIPSSIVSDIMTMVGR